MKVRLGKTILDMEDVVCMTPRASWGDGIFVHLKDGRSIYLDERIEDMKKWTPPIEEVEEENE